MKKVFSIIAIIFTFCINTNTFSATLLVDDYGELFGATGVQVEGSFYDVAFVEDTGYNLFFDGTNWNFDFDAEASALAASQALLDQVLLDVPGLGDFDSETELIRGIETDYVGVIATPFYASSIFFYIAGADNYSSSYPGIDVANPHYTGIELASTDLTTVAHYTYAVWSPSSEPVPEPTTMLLFGTGVAGLVGARLRRKK